MRHLDGNDFMEKNGYEVEGSWYPRVTKILEVKAKPALEGFFREMGSYEAADGVKNKSAEEGTLVHEMVQKTAIGAKPTAYACLGPQCSPPVTEADALLEVLRGQRTAPAA